MEIWIDPEEMVIKAVYSHRYNGGQWQSLGYEPVEMFGKRVPAIFRIGAKIRLVDGGLEVTAPPPPPIPDPRFIRIRELGAKLAQDNISLAELTELLRLERIR